MNSLAFLLLVLLLPAAISSRIRVVEAVGTPPAHVSGGEAAEGAATAAAGSSSAVDAAQPAFFDVDDALAAIRAQAAAGSGNTPLSPAAAATAGRTAMDNACGPGLGRCTLVMGGCCSERGTCGWECRGACQGPFSAPGFCDTDLGGGGGGTAAGSAGDEAAAAAASSARLADRAADLRDRLRAAFVGNVVSRATSPPASSAASRAPGVCDIWERYDDDGSQGLGVDGRPLEPGASGPGEGLGPRPFTGWGSTVALAGAGVYFDI